MKTKYKKINLINGHDILQNGPCKEEFDNFCKKYGFYDEVEWTKENEDFIISQNGWIEWLLKEKFIEKNVLFHFNEDNVYIWVDLSIGDAYKLHRDMNDDWSWLDLGSSICLANGSFKSAKKAIEEILKRKTTFNKIYECNSMEDFYKGIKKEI